VITATSCLSNDLSSNRICQGCAAEALRNRLITAPVKEPSEFALPNI
jgi:hypothetical protein